MRRWRANFIGTRPLSALIVAIYQRGATADEVVGSTTVRAWTAAGARRKAARQARVWRLDYHTIEVRPR